jgi:hypothetical protein
MKFHVCVALVVRTHTENNVSSNGPISDSRAKRHTQILREPSLIPLREPSMTSSEQPSKEQLEIWLAEYAAANSTRDHYDSTRWLIGSIFIAAIFTLFASSFLDPVARNNIALGMLAETSTILWFVFVYYDQSVQPWVTAAIDRCHKIEEKLRNANYDIYLHAWIKYQRDKSDTVDFAKKRSHLGAIWVIYFFSILIPTLWILRLWLVR